MRHNKLSLYVHIVWTTWDREPFLTPFIEPQVHRVIEHEAQKLGCAILAIGGVEDHVHILIEFPPTVALSHLVKQIKGVSSLFVNEELHPDFQFKWRGSYAALTVSRWDVKSVVGYIQRQKQHHAEGTTKKIFEEIEEGSET